MFFATVGIGDLAEEQTGVLGLEDDELVEPWIGFGRGWHDSRIGFPGGLTSGKTERQRIIDSAGKLMSIWIP